MSDVFKLRAVVAIEPNSSWPVIAFAVSEDTWGIIPPEEWDLEKRKLLENWLGPDWPSHDFAEVVLDVPMDSLRGLFSPAIPVKVSE